MRVHILAKALNVTSKDILAKCQAEGIPVKNHMSTLGPGLEATVREWFSEGAHTTTIERADRVDLKKVRKRRVKKKTPEAEATPEAPPSDTSAEAPAKAPEPAEEQKETPGEAPPAETPAPAELERPEVAAEERTAPAPEAPAPASEEPAVAPAVAAEEPEAAPLPVESSDARQAAAEAPAAEETPEAEPAPEEQVKPAGPQNVPAPAKLSGPRVVRYEAPEEYVIPRRGPRRRPAAEGDTGVSEPGPPDAGAPGKGRGRRRVADDRTGAKRGGQRRSTRSAADASERLTEWNDQDLAERRERLRGATGRRAVSRRAVGRGGGGGGAHAAPITKAELQEPIMVKQLCGAIGVPFQRMFPVLHKEHNLMLSLASIIPKEVAELVALNFGVELTVVEAKTGQDRIREEHEAIERKNLQQRPPIVTVLGHVDHGKTSLLDHIRRARVAKHEDGGITQHISSYHYKKGDVAVTFLDTPGHEAFTALRARGAQLTDIVVLVIAADDGVMPQTVEAINHAKAAKVPIVVALNKIDLGDQNVTRIYSQLVQHGLTPSGDWGGEVDVVHTSASTGQGIDELLELLSTMSELHDYKADPKVPATGTVVEAESRQGVGAVLQVIVREGTVRVGDILVCGNSFGKVRAIHDDTGQSVQKMGPAMPAEIWGMNEVPSSGDHFYQVETMQRAKESAEEVKSRRRTDARSSINKARSLDDLMRHQTDADVKELNVIVKGDVDGSVDVLAHALTQFPSDEVKLNVLHAGIGAVTDSDVQLADASNAIIVAFRVTAPGKTRRLAEEKGVDIRSYKVIYDVTDDIKKALEGLLAPEEVIESRGALEVREVFRISKVGLVAGSYVTDGTVAANHFARVVRGGTIVRDNCRFNSLKRFKDDVKEVRAGMECGVRLEGFDDIKVGDVIETFEVIKVARTLD